MKSLAKLQNHSKEELIQELILFQEEKDQLQKKLAEKHKKFHALVQISNLMEDEHFTLAEILQKIVRIIPSGWQYPEITCARIVVGNQEYKTTNFRTTAWSQSEILTINDKTRGRIEVFYLEEKADAYEGPFLLEERELIQLIAERLGKIASRKILEEEFDAIFKGSPVAKCIIDLDQENQFADVNNAFVKFSGYSRNELIGKRPSKLGLFKDENVNETFINLLKRDGVIRNFKFDYVRKNGEITSAIINSKLIIENGRNLVISSFVDLTEHKKSEQELIQTKEMLEGIFANLDDAYIQVDLSGKITYCNPAAPKIFGYSSVKEMIGMPVVRLYANKEDRDYMLKELRDAGSIYDKTYIVRRKNSSTFWGAMNVKFIYSDTGQIKGTQGLIRDITERKETEFLLQQAKEEAEKSEARFKAISEQANDGIALADTKGHYVFVNQAFCKMMGYTEQELLTMTVFDLAAEKDENLFSICMKESKKIDGALRKRLICKDKSFIYVDLNVTELSVGNEKMALGIHRDVTELVQREKELIEAKNKAEESEYRYRKAQEVGHIGSWEYDLKNNTFWGSDEGKRIYNLSLNQKDFPVDEVMKCVVEEDRERVNQALIDLVQENKPYDIVFTIVPKNTNKRKVIRSKAELLRDENNKPVKITGVLHDITLQKHFERELVRAKEKAEENQSRMHTLLNTIPDLVWLKDTEGIYLQCNKRFEDFFGSKQNEIIGKTDYDFVDKQTADYFRAHDKKAMLVGGPTINEEQITFAIDGHKEYLETIKMPLYDIDKKIVGILGIGRDITQRISVEKELIRAKEKAEESDRLKSAFLMNVSHEIRTPMNGILGFIDLLNEPDLDEEDRRTFIDTVTKSGERLLNTINDIVEISKIEIGDIQLLMEEVDTSELMQFQYNFFKVQAQAKGVQLKMTQQITGWQALINTDKQKLDGIIMNLLRNAIKFTNHGTIELGNYIENNKMYFYISDTGRGIPEDKLEVIFDRFVQAELSNSRGYEGSGIGLSIVKAYIEALNGEIQVKSELGKGSTFLFSIPYSPVMAKKSETEHPKEPELTNDKCTLLIVEDDDVNYYFLEQILAKKFKLLHAESGEEAIQVFNGNPQITLVLMDIKMPGKYDGLETTRKIRENNEAVPIIAQTAYATERDKTMAFEAGCDAYISKPYSPGDLNALIRKFCKKSPR